jgi:hypothetical protein
MLEMNEPYTQRRPKIQDLCTSGLNERWLLGYRAVASRIWYTEFDNPVETFLHQPGSESSMPSKSFS